MFSIKSLWIATLALALVAFSWLAPAEEYSASDTNIVSDPQRQSDSLQPAVPAEPASLSATASVDVRQEDINEESESALADSCAETIPVTNIAAKLESILADGSIGAACLRESLVRRWATNDPVSASSWAAQVSQTRAGQDALRQVAIAWAAVDFSAAGRWLGQLTETDAAKEAMLGAAYEAARDQPTAALEFATGLGAGEDRDNLLVHAAAQWAVLDPSAAAGWAQTIPHSAIQQQVIASISAAVADTDPGAAADLASSSLSPGELQNRAAVEIAQRWAENSPRDAAAWISMFRVSALKDVATQDLMSIWTEQDPVDAADWWKRLPDGRIKFDASRAYRQALDHPNQFSTGRQNQ
jgi:hypothetical protein